MRAEKRYLYKLYEEHIGFLSVPAFQSFLFSSQNEIMHTIKLDSLQYLSRVLTLGWKQVVTGQLKCIDRSIESSCVSLSIRWAHTTHHGDYRCSDDACCRHG